MCQADKGAKSSYDALIDLLETIEDFMGRLEINIDLPVMPAMQRIIVKIMVELLSIFAIATKQIKQSRPGECIPVR